MSGQSATHMPTLCAALSQRAVIFYSTFTSLLSYFLVRVVKIFDVVPLSSDNYILILTHLQILEMLA